MPGNSSCRRCCTLRCGAVSSVVVGAILLGIGLAAVPVIHLVLRNQIANELPLTSTSSALYDTWSDPVDHNAVTHMQFYIYNVTNHLDIAHHGAKPRVDLVGPFSYVERRVKHNIRWNADETIVYYKVCMAVLAHVLTSVDVELLSSFVLTLALAMMTVQHDVPLH